MVMLGAVHNSAETELCSSESELITIRPCAVERSVAFGLDSARSEVAFGLDSSRSEVAFSLLGVRPSVRPRVYDVRPNSVRPRVYDVRPNSVRPRVYDVRPNSVRPRVYDVRPNSVRPFKWWWFLFYFLSFQGLTRVVGVVGGPRVDAITRGLFRGNGLALCMVGWNPSAMALQSNRGHHKCTTRPSSTYILCPDMSRVLT
ncbi:hypothetical protein LR48_Vigan05g128300 [Vigna angularis]|uniref:Uncharacterized protein n=1 Tax=Phaseolus angularis TaxID=3914 RepID=A0A0L9ULP2_PHAAN|nr:hypothetical protein LR48_Vigan05g128300 [Vigna angularis]